ncbi:DUF3300 domain-containing protein [Paraburkholderia unamae]|uniref:Uncharacterized protein DUF3300 n=1 Tax=Paraburkholderia unamae TaxID=219649 RepID=A0ABX5KGM1_9BURK|nr:DUF3300 domain-containing protein [Paraburkholderia unamae]PVX76271.1 uncharacterized protein DUF3300 [Paraburkholderia unamae]CAG9270927.1 conserved exported hypothetical protein [Paraburkholderia unamae]
MNPWIKQRMYRVCLLVLALLFTGAQVVRSQDAAQPAPYKPEELEALVAPIALYPDSVLAQVLMASTYPLEIVHAARWVKEHPKVKGDDAVKAVQDQTWDASVKSLVAFPQVLEPMNDKLDWTQKLGDAFLAQEKDVLAAVQRLRTRAQDSGNLKSNEQQKVVVEQPPAQGGQTIVKIEPANPEVIYVPAYNPTVVYGAWSYPAYPPYYWPPSPAYYPGGALMTGFAWGVGLAAAGAIFGNCNWGGGDVNIDVNKVRNVDRNFDRSKVEGGKWKHDSSHRQGVAYRDNATREKFGNNTPGADSRRDYRGRNNGQGGANVADRGGNRGNGVGGGQGLGGGDRGNQGGLGNNRGGVGNNASVGNRADIGNNGGVGGNRGNAGNGVGNNAGAGNRANAGNNAGAGNRANVGNNAGAGNRANVGNNAGASNRANVGNNGAAGNRVSTGAGGGYGGGGGGGYGGGGGRDSAFQGVGSGAATQRDASRGRSSVQSSGFNRPSGGGGGMRGGGGGGRGGGRR